MPVVARVSVIIVLSMPVILWQQLKICHNLAFNLSCTVGLLVIRAPVFHEKCQSLYFLLSFNYEHLFLIKSESQAHDAQDHEVQAF